MALKPFSWGRGRAGWRCLGDPLVLPSPSLSSLLPPVEKVDNTLTLIILAVVGGVIGLLVLIMLVKKLVLFVLKKTQEKK